MITAPLTTKTHKKFQLNQMRKELVTGVDQLVNTVKFIIHYIVRCWEVLDVR